MTKIRPIAYYLPQFHPIPENDNWWGKGFTEWTNVAKAKPLFRGHEQPKLPADLGFYDLRIPEVRQLQAQMAKEAGIEGFCYWHYWFGNGERLLERPFQEVLESGKPDFPFCLGWANESWTGIWHGSGDTILMEQKYPGIKDYEAHFYELLPAFKDNRYIKVDDKPVFLVYNVFSLPDVKEFSDTFRKLAKENGLRGIYLIASNSGYYWNPADGGFDASTFSPHSNIYLFDVSLKTRIKRRIRKTKVLRDVYGLFTNKPIYTFNYRDALITFNIDKKFDFEFYHTIVTGFDNSPRSGKNSFILKGYTPELFRLHLQQVLPKVSASEQKIVFIKSWNEWAEGNYLEPDIRYGANFLNVFKEEISKIKI